MLKCLGAKVESFDRKHTIMSEGDSSRYIGIVLSGSVRVIRLDYYGNRNIIGSAKASEMFL